jgi:hypothetical protein
LLPVAPPSGLAGHLSSIRTSSLRYLKSAFLIFPAAFLIVEQVALIKLILNCPSVRYYPNDNSAIEPLA